MLNAGLQLRRPLESEIGAYRRFLIANRALGHSNISELLKENQAGPKKHPALARALEQQICLKLGISYLEPRSPFSVSRTRNCAACARSGYHSYLFDLTWIEKCPVHQLDLVHRCPDCNQPWPHPYEFYDRRCKCCGLGAKFSVLARRKALEPPDMWQALVEMDAVIHNHLERQDLVLLRGSHATEYDTTEIKSAAVTDRFWPVVCVPRTPGWERLCDSFGVQLSPIIERRFRLKKPPPGSSRRHPKKT